jgi:hypothetical protein
MEYTIVAEARNQQVLWFRRFGSYSGEWLLLSKGTSAEDNLYYLYKDYYGSCSGCDDIEATFDYDEDDLPLDDPKIQEFIEKYPSFLEMKPDAALRIAIREGNLLAVLPKNVRMDFDSTDAESVGKQLALMIKLDQNNITSQEILEIDNQETRREAIEKFGTTQFVESLNPTEIDREGENVLYRFERGGEESYCFLYLKDGSTDRRYILRVSPTIQTVNDGRAASFGIPADRFKNELVVET